MNVKMTQESRLLPSPKEVGVSIVIPAYNEAGAVKREVGLVRDALRDTEWPFEVIVVDDGSDDRTAERAKSAGAHVLTHGANKGYGAALKTGIRNARYGIICITDADGTYPPGAIPKLITILEEEQSHMVVGSRTGPEAKIPWMRKPAKWILARLAEMVVGETIPDLNSGQRTFRRKTVERFFNLLPDGFSFTTTITLAMASNGYKITYDPITYARRVGRSKIRPIRDTLGFIGLILRIALYFAPLKIFLPLSGVLCLAALVVGLVSSLILGNLADVSTIVLVIAAVQVAVVGLVAELINRRVINVYLPDD